METIVYFNGELLEKLFESYNGENLSECFSWNEPIGKEIW